MSFLAATELCLVLRELGIAARPERRPPAARFDDDTCLEVAEAEVSTPSTLAQLTANATPPTVLVVGQLRPSHQAALEQAGVGWLDRGGHLRIPSLELDRQVTPLSAPVPPFADIWRRPSVVAVALVLLQREGPAPSVHDLGFHAGIVRNAAVGALEALRSVAMIDDHAEPDRDALRLHLTARWSTRWFGLRELPDLTDLDPHERLVLGIEDDLRRPGWALLDDGSDDAASTSPPRLLVPDRRALGWVSRRWGATDQPAAALAAAAPNPIATAARRPGPSGYPLAHPETVTLERDAPGRLAAEPAGPDPETTGRPGLS